MVLLLHHSPSRIDLSMSYRHKNSQRSLAGNLYATLIFERCKDTTFFRTGKIKFFCKLSTTCYSHIYKCIFNTPYPKRCHATKHSTVSKIQKSRYLPLCSSLIRCRHWDLLHHRQHHLRSLLLHLLQSVQQRSGSGYTLPSAPSCSWQTSC